MKKQLKILFTLLLSILMMQVSEAQIKICDVASDSCLPEGIFFRTQGEVDSFQVCYPGCNYIIGDVVISGDGSPAIKNLSGLNVIESIAGRLTVLADSICNLDGLNNLEKIDGDLSILDCKLLKDLSGFESLSHIGSLYIKYNDSLNSLSGFENLVAIEEDVFIEDNPLLANLVGLDNLNTIGGSLIISNNPLLSSCSVEGLCDYLASPNGVVSICGNAEGCSGPPEIARECGFTMPCLPFGHYCLLSQEDIDSFHSDYPGCYDLEGNVSIWGEDITNLNGLSEISSIGGSLHISGCHNLDSLSGLDSITIIGGDFWIYYNDSLNALSGFEGLKKIGGRLIIGYNLYLDNFSAFNSLDSIYGGLGLSHIRDTSFSGFGSLASVGDDLSIYGCSFKNLSGLSNLDYVGGGLNLGSSDRLVNLNGLENLASIGGNLRIESNNSLASLEGLENLNSMAGGVEIAYNQLLYDITALENLETDSVSFLNIYANPLLSICNAQAVCDYLASPNGPVSVFGNASGCRTPGEIASGCGFSIPCLPYGNYIFVSQSDVDNFQSDYPDCDSLNGEILIAGDDISDLDGLGSLTSISGNFRIGSNELYFGGISPIGNPILTGLEGLDNLSRVSGDMEIVCNDALTDLSGLNSLTGIGGDFSISQCPYLEYFYGLEKLDSIGGSLSISGNMYNFNGLEGLASIGRNFTVRGPYINSLSGLDNLSRIAGGLMINQCSALRTLKGIESLDTIGGSLVIGGDWSSGGNPVLINLSGLNHNMFIGGDLVIGYNSSLSSCDVYSICVYLDNPNGEVFIFENAPGCNDPEEVDEACGTVVVEDIQEENNIMVYPNPTSGLVDFRFRISDAERVSIKIFDLQGREILTLMDRKLPAGSHIIGMNSNEIVPGIYIYRLLLHSTQQVRVGKLAVGR